MKTGPLIGEISDLLVLLPAAAVVFFAVLRLKPEVYTV